MSIYNTGRYIDESINSLLEQSIGFKKIQLILVNDGSTDDSEEKCFHYQKLYPKNIFYFKMHLKKFALFAYIIFQCIN